MIRKLTLVLLLSIGGLLSLCGQKIHDINFGFPYNQVTSIFYKDSLNQEEAATLVEYFEGVKEEEYANSHYIRKHGNWLLITDGISSDTVHTVDGKTIISHGMQYKIDYSHATYIMYTTHINGVAVHYLAYPFGGYPDVVLGHVKVSPMRRTLVWVTEGKKVIYEWVEVETDTKRD